ncbi:hypothetical protein K439DRAFT_1661827 [Ramaria rubella]|nr:hypothetical protein K439DRAFT_1661827 [Ramaria rubella]
MFRAADSVPGTVVGPSLSHCLYGTTDPNRYKTWHGIVRCSVMELPFHAFRIKDSQLSIICGNCTDKATACKRKQRVAKSSEDSEKEETWSYMCWDQLFDEVADSMERDLHYRVIVDTNVRHAAPAVWSRPASNVGMPYCPPNILGDRLRRRQRRRRTSPLECHRRAHAGLEESLRGVKSARRGEGDCRESGRLRGGRETARREGDCAEGEAATAAINHSGLFDAGLGPVISACSLRNLGIGKWVMNAGQTCSSIIPVDQPLEERAYGIAEALGNASALHSILLMRNAPSILFGEPREESVAKVAIPPDSWWPKAVRSRTAPFYFVPGTTSEELPSHETSRYHWLPWMPGDLPTLFTTPHRTLQSLRTTNVSAGTSSPMTIHRITSSPAGAAPSEGDHQLSNGIENGFMSTDLDSRCDAIEEKLRKALAIIHAHR